MEYANITNHLMTFMPGSEQTECVKAEGISFTDAQGKTWLNLNDISCVLGYNHPRFTSNLVEAVQTKALGHLGSVSVDKELLIQNFMESTHGDFEKILITSSGGETVDWSVKAARRHTGRDGIISFHEEKILSHVQEAGTLLSRLLEEMLLKFGIAGKLRGKGLFYSLELPDGMAAEISAAGKEQGIILGRSGNRLLFRPPLVITDAEIRTVCTFLEKYFSVV